MVAIDTWYQHGFHLGCYTALLNKSAYSFIKLSLNKDFQYNPCKHVQTVFLTEPVTTQVNHMYF